jgi:folate-binding protein YgfZ
MFSTQQYRALVEHAGLVDRSARGQLTFSGADRASFLQGLLTNDVAALAAGGGCYAAMLTPNGRMIADMRLFELGHSMLMDVDASQAAALRERFDNMIFSEDAQVEDVSGARASVGVYGPSAARVVVDALQGSGPTVLQLEAMPVHANRVVESGSGALVVVRSAESGIDGFDLFADNATLDRCSAALIASGAIAVGAEAAEVTRIEAGRPRFLVDMDEDTIPLEAGIEDRAISLTKGCYVGQEIIIRVLHRAQGRVARRLVGLSFDPAAALPSRGDRIQANDRQVGAVTSAAHSPALGRPVALGYVHRDSAAAGTTVAVDSAGALQPAVVTALPFVHRRTASAA